MQLALSIKDAGLVIICMFLPFMTFYIITILKSFVLSLPLIYFKH